MVIQDPQKSHFERYSPEDISTYFWYAMLMNHMKYTDISIFDED